MSLVDDLEKSLKTESAKKFFEEIEQSERREMGWREKYKNLPKTVRINLAEKLLKKLENRGVDYNSSLLETYIGYCESEGISLMSYIDAEENPFTVESWLSPEGYQVDVLYGQGTVFQLKKFEKSEILRNINNKLQQLKDSIKEIEEVKNKIERDY